MDIHVRKLPGGIIEEEFYLVSDVRELESDAMVMALRLYGENPYTFGPECWEVMQRWGPKVKVMLSAAGAFASPLECLVGRAERGITWKRS